LISPTNTTRECKAAPAPAPLKQNLRNECVLTPAALVTPAWRSSTRRRCGPWSRILVTEVDPALGQIIRRHFNCDFVASQNADAILFHAARRVGDHFVTVVEFHAAAGVWQNFHNDAFELEHFFFSHAVPLVRAIRVETRGAMVRKKRKGEQIASAPQTRAASASKLRADVD
jgi:hypothetical protein